MTTVDARQVADRLSTCPDVTGLHPGPLGTIVTATEAGPLIGIRTDTAMVVLGVVVGPGGDAADVAARIRARVADVVQGLPISLSFRELAA